MLEYKEKYIDAKGKINEIAAELQKEKYHNDYLKGEQDKYSREISTFEYMSTEIKKKGAEYADVFKKYSTANTKCQEARKLVHDQEESINIMTSTIKMLEGELAQLKSRSPPRYIQPADIMARGRERDRARSRSKYVR